ncbi:MAG: hypothetical protein GY851_31370 [bacterium]|nr:hypothetical protein [bacterium]
MTSGCKERGRHEDRDDPALAGVPLGGIGTGCIELGRDGRFRNITINNNRSAAARIPVSEGALLAVRAARRGRVHTRMLQAGSGLPFEKAGIVPTYTPPEQLNWRGLYPCSHYKLDDQQFPLDVTWSGMTPIIPYDTDASSLPLVFMTVYVKNTTDATLDVATVLNWENLCGCTRGDFPSKRGPIRPVLVMEDLQYALKDNDKEDTDDSDSNGPPRFAGFEFGFRGEHRSNAEGNYCLLAKQQRDVDVSLMSWDERNPRELEAFWQAFHDEGRLMNKLSRAPESHSGSVCCSFPLEAKKGRSLVYIVSWHCPRFVVDGTDLGNGYANDYPNALEVANRALAHYRYYFNSVEDWQNRIMSSSLPRWFNRSLINCNYVLSTNTLLTQDRQFTLMETPEDPLTGAMDRRFHSSLGPLLLFPEYETRELAHMGTAVNPEQKGRIYRYHGRECPNNPSNGENEHGDPQAELLDINPKFVLMAYRNFQMTGKLFMLEQAFPRLKEAMAHMRDRDEDNDGLPEHGGTVCTYGDWPLEGVDSYTSGLWLVALRAYVKLAKRLGHDDEAKLYEKILVKARKRFDALLWDEDHGYYRFYRDPADTNEAHEQEYMGDACHCSQLAGQWYADFLSLGRILPEDRVRKALGALCKIGEKRYGVAKAVMPDGGLCPGPHPDSGAPDTGTSWPSFYTAEYCSLLMTHGYTDRALYVLQKTFKNIFARRGRTFNQPLGWDLETNDARGWGSDRHMGSTSIWHVYYALQGFYLSLPERQIWVRPNLPYGVHFLSAPLFTSVCLGWLKFREEVTDRYEQRVDLTFDSPIQLKRVVLRVPDGVEDVHVSCESAEGTEETEHYFGDDGPDRLVEIAPTDGITVKGTLTIVLKQTKGRRVQLDGPDREPEA